MDYFEAEGKKLYKRFGIPTDEGVLYRSEDDLRKINYPAVVKAQVQSGHRGQAGGIKFVKNAEELKVAVEYVSALTIGGKAVEGVLVVPAIDIYKEHYLGITIDAANRKAVLLYSSIGGMDIEEVAAKTPMMLSRLDVTKYLDDSALEKLILQQNVEKSIATKIVEVANKLFVMFKTLDATTVEINPLVELKNGDLTAADSKLVIDDNALHRQGNYMLLSRPEKRDANTLAAEKMKVSYTDVDPNGEIGIIAGGAGIGMTTVDTVKKYGLKPFNFMDIGNCSPEKLRAATLFLMDKPQVKAILVNVFGGFNNCEWMADGVAQAAIESNYKIPIVMKSRGHFQDEGWEILKKAGIPHVKYGTTDDAVIMLRDILEGKR